MFFFVVNDISKLRAVFRIHDILERIRIRGPVPLTNGSGQRKVTIT
jgi:hypothetical protein